MRRSKYSTIVFAYNSFNDPLFQNLVFQYILELSSDPDHEFHVITFEQREYNIDPERKAIMQADFLKADLHWYPLEYAYGSVLLFNKFRNLIDAFRLVGKLKRNFATSNLLCFGNVAAAFGGLLSSAFKMKSIIIQYEPHHLFLLELNRWSKRSVKYQILSNLEELARKRADFIMTGTSHMIKALQEKGTKAKVFRTPNAVDQNLMKFDGAERERIREQFEMADRDVFIYIGKLGELYYEEELVEVCSSIYKKNDNALFLVITGYDHGVLMSWFEKWGVPETAYRLLKPVPHREVPGYLSAADMGMVAIPPTPAQKYRSPLKTADYLYCGLPYLICRGISEDDSYAEQYQVGVVVEKFSAEHINLIYSQIDNLLNEEKNILRDRCRQVGIEYRNRKRVLITINDILTEV